ncbi:MAG: hypothetical protein HY706_15085 [Candidatus Hydrogenedentes bacterium]|nr:hypothetical protein [Candidatus Hydrogenedentota bacterium]
MNAIRQRCLGLLVVINGLLVGIGCTGPTTPPAKTSPASPDVNETPVDGDWLVARMPDEMPTLNPFTSTDVYSQRILLLVMESLLERDNQTLELGPGLAESYTVSDDHLVYTFKLRPGVVFSDGTPLTAQDVKFSFDTLMDPTVDALHLRNYFVNVATCDVADELTAKFTCKEPYFKTHIALGEDLKIIPKHIYGQGDFNKHPNNRHPIGSGRYVFERWETNQQLVLTRNERYWGTKPHLLKRVYKIITDDNAALQVLNRQDLDVMALGPDQWATHAQKPEFEAKFNKFQYYTPSHSYIGWNLRRPQLSDKGVRRALTMLLDRQTILDTIYHGLGKVVTGNFFIETAEYSKDIEPWPFDPAGAQRLLDEAGWIDSNGDGFRDKDGTPLRIEFMIVTGSDEAEQLATVYKEELDKAGIDFTIRKLEWATFLESTQEHRFDACMLAWGLDPESDPYQLWHSSQAEKGSNYVGFINADADRIIDEARREFDRNKRIEMYHRLNHILHEEQPYTFLFCPAALQVVDKRFHNVKVYPLGLDAREWYVPAALQRYK